MESHEQLRGRGLAVEAEGTGEELRDRLGGDARGERDDSRVTFGEADGVALGDPIGSFRWLKRAGPDEWSSCYASAGWCRVIQA